jgi:hypothetical protein
LLSNAFFSWCTAGGTQGIILARQARSHGRARPFCVGYSARLCQTILCGLFWDKVSLYVQDSLDCDLPIFFFPTWLGWEAWTTALSFWLRWGWTFGLGWPRATIILLKQLDCRLELPHLAPIYICLIQVLSSMLHCYSKIVIWVRGILFKIVIFKMLTLSALVALLDLSLMQSLGCNQPR